MKQSYAKQSLGLLLLILGMTTSLSSCIYDDMSQCGLHVRFRYTHNMKEADGFAKEADWVKLWIFDAEDKMVAQYEEGSEFISSKKGLKIEQLPAGNYTFVAWAGSAKHTGQHSDFDFPTLKKGDSMTSLSARLERDSQGENRSKLNALLNGTLKTSITGVKQDVVIDLMKCTNTLRIILMPSNGKEKLHIDNFECFIEGENGWLAYDASPLRPDELIYRPYYQELSEDKAEGPNGEAVVNQAIITELNTSRIMANTTPRLIIRNKETKQDILNINLSWFLSLQAIGEHRAEWSDQEYLDRQDEYSITFFTNGSTWMQTHIIVNGWVLSLQDIEL